MPCAREEFVERGISSHDAWGENREADSEEAPSPIRGEGFTVKDIVKGENAAAVGRGDHDELAYILGPSPSKFREGSVARKSLFSIA